MTAGTHLVAFDVDAIKDYVFGAVRPLDIAGASRIVEAFTVEAGREPGAVYAGGGNGLLRVASARAAAALCEQLEARFADRTQHGGSCTAAYVAEGGDFTAARRLLRHRVGRRKAERQLDEPSWELVPRATQVCQACGREPGNLAAGRAGDADEQWIGRQCQRRRQEGRKSRSVPGQPAPAWSLEELSISAEERRPAIAAVYLDADAAGKLLLELDGARLPEFARDVQRVTTAALHDAIGTLGLDGHYLAPVVGGDDLLVLLDGARAAGMLGQLWDGLGPLGTRWGLTFSAGVAFGPARIPLRLLVDQAEDALRLAKRRPAVGGGGGPAVAVTTLLGGRLHDPARPLFGGPVPQGAWQQVEGLVEALTRVAPAQRAGMTVDVAQPSEQLIALDLDYRAAAGWDDGQAVRAAVEQARRLAERLRATVPGVTLSAVLLGGLVAAEFRR